MTKRVLRYYEVAVDWDGEGDLGGKGGPVMVERWRLTDADDAWVKLSVLEGAPAADVRLLLEDALHLADTFGAYIDGASRRLAERPLPTDRVYQAGTGEGDAADNGRQRAWARTVPLGAVQG